MEADDAPESLKRIGFGVKDVGQAVATLKTNGVECVESKDLHPEDRGALTRSALGSVSFALVHQSS
jgi:4-hydroxyphenylpyruvate dioxygenase